MFDSHGTQSLSLIHILFGSASDGIEYAFDFLNGRLNFIVHNNIVVFRNVFKLSLIHI